MADLQFEMTWPERGRWAGLFTQSGTSWSEVFDRTEELLGPHGDRWYGTTLTLYLVFSDGHRDVQGIKVKAVVIDSDEDAVAFKIAMHETLLRLVNLTAE